MLTPLQEFLDHEADGFVRSELLSAIDGRDAGRHYFTYNTFNVLLDGDSQLVTVEDELDVGRAEIISFKKFEELLKSPRRSI